MVIVGLCGNSGSGKGYVCNRFSSYGVAFIDTDKVYREEVLTDERCKSELVGYFGSCILKNGQVSKKRLAPLVFEGEGAPARLEMLNKITHKYIKIKTDELVDMYDKQGYPAVLIDAPVLFESGFDSMCHVTVCVTAPYETKIARIMKRDNVSREKAEARLKTQLGEDELIKRCTYAINNTDGCDVNGQIKSILKDLSIE